ncbi:MAG: hypothetical protein ACRDHP_11505 [Ktedonobacterales bacterium]
MTTEFAPAAVKTPRYLTIAWGLLLLLGAFLLFAAFSDLAADAGVGLPSDHLGTFHAVAGLTWDAARQSSPGIAHYITLLEVAYAVHELVFGVLFLVIVAIPFRRRARWAWWACWAVLLADVTYTLTFGAHDPTILTRSLVALIALPVLLLVQAPAFFGKRARRAESLR